MSEGILGLYYLILDRLIGGRCIGSVVSALVGESQSTITYTITSFGRRIAGLSVSWKQAPIEAQ